MQTPGRQVESTSSIFGGRGRESASQNTVATTKLLQQIDKLSQNVTGLRGQLDTEKKDRIAFDNKKSQLLKREQKSLEDLKSATIDFRKIIGLAAGASALRQFSQGDIGGGLQDTGVAITAFLPEIIGITQNVIVGGLAARGLLGGGRGFGAAGMARGMGGRGGLLALPLLAALPLLMGAGRQNNQSNAPTAEFRREQETRRIRKDTISAPDTQRFSAQLDKFDVILSSMGKKERIRTPVSGDVTPPEFENVDEKSDEFLFDDGDPTRDPITGRKDIPGQILDLVKMINPFSSNFGRLGKSELQLRQEAKDDFQIFGTIFEEILKLFGGKEEEEKDPLKNNFKEDVSNDLSEDLSNIEPGAFTEVNDEEAENIINRDDKVTNIPPSLEKGRKTLQGVAEKLSFPNPDFVGTFGKEKGTKLESLFNFITGIAEEIPNATKEKNLEKTASTIMGLGMNKLPDIDKSILNDAPPEIQNIFGAMFNDDGKMTFFDEAKTQFAGDDGIGAKGVHVETEFPSINRFINRLQLGAITND